jgi:hypothetical protein
MKINKHNYEAFFLDYHEGNLTPQQVADLLLFVEQNPQLKEEFESFENIMLEDYSSYNFSNKQELKKEISLQNQEEYFIRSVEGTLNKTEEQLLNNYLKQHPQFLPEFGLFQKTKLVADSTIVFEGKENLKRIPETADNLLISAVEGLLSKEESTLLKQQLIVDSLMNQEFKLYQQTKLQADPAVVYKNKEELKRKNRKTIPLFYYISGVAAAVLLLFGLFTFFNNGKAPEPGLAVETTPVLKNNSGSSSQDIPAISPEKNPVDPGLVNSLAVKNEKNKRGSNNVNPVIPEKNIPVITEQQEHIVFNTPVEIKEAPEKQIVQEKTMSADVYKSDAVAKTEDVKAPSKEFLSLGQMAAAKIKEKTLDPETLEIEKKNGRLKKINAWDIAQIVAKGVSKVTGKKVEAKPQYNEEGEVTAYALGAGGFQISRAR